MGWTPFFLSPDGLGRGLPDPAFPPKARELFPARFGSATQLHQKLPPPGLLFDSHKNMSSGVTKGGKISMRIRIVRQQKQGFAKFCCPCCFAKMENRQRAAHPSTIHN